MAIFVLTNDGGCVKIANTPDKFQCDTNVPFPGYFRITTEEGQIYWFNAAHVILVGEVEMEIAREMPSQHQGSC